MRLLLLSNSTSPGKSYLEHAKQWFVDFLPTNARIAFVPFAGVTISWDAYTRKFNEFLETLNMSAEGVHNIKNPADVISDYDALAVGGGNTFNLLKELYDRALMDPFKQAVINQLPYIGWSAGSNLACPYIYTTNDMPIVQPTSFEGFSFIPFQINPHYTEQNLLNHHGETRLQRLLEYVEAHPDSKVLGLPEGSALRFQNKQIDLLGDQAALIEYEKERQWIKDLNPLLADEI
jgi:dipeptidase E